MAGETRLDRIGGRYRLVKELGSGGFGRVWKAHDESLGVDVAIKEVRLPQAASDAERAEFLTRARREARNAARLRDHPGILPVHDVVTEDEVPWIVMRLVDGRSLADRLAGKGRLSPEETARIAEAMLRALDAAHAAGVVHRDIKPANVMLTGAGEVLLTDFGIAVHETDTAMTASGAVIGSMEYLAPERLRGKNNGPAGDLFSLGVTLYRCVEGVSPFRRGTPAETVTALLQDEPPRPEHAGTLAPLIVRLLDKTPETRPTAAQALSMIGRPSDGDAGREASRTTTRIRRPGGRLPVRRRVFRRPRRRTYWLVAAAAVVALPPVLGLGYVTAYGGTAYNAQTDDCVHSDGLDIDGLGQWRTHPCWLALPWKTNYEVTWRYDEARSCSSFVRTQILPSREQQKAITLCLIPDK